MKKLNLSIFSLVIIVLSFNLCLAETLSDALYDKQWALQNKGQTIYLQDSDLSRQNVVGINGMDIHYVDTNSIPSAKSELIVAVLDSGIDLTHPDLVGKIWYNQKLCQNAPNAKVLPCNGWNFLDNNNNLLDDVGHGTHLAGIIAANKNAIGIRGAADSRIKIMPLKVLNNTVNGFVYNGKLITDVIADAMIFAIKNGAEVINLSLGWPKLIDTAKIRLAFKMAEDQNVMVIAASGNNNKDFPTYPCGYDSVVCVAALDNRGFLTDFTNHGAKVELAAPGEYIVSTLAQNLESRVLRIKGYEAKRGSSQAAPYVTSAIATLKLLNPNLSNDRVRELIAKSSTSFKDKTDRFVRFGRLDYKQLLDSSKNESDALIIPQTKSLSEIKFSASHPTVNLAIAFRNVGDKNFSGEVCLNSESENIQIQNECISDVSIGSHLSTNLSFQISLNDLSKDSHVNFNIKIDDKTFRLNVVFSRDLSNDSDVVEKSILGGNFDEMAVISSGRKISKMVRVLDKYNLSKMFEYFYLEKSKQTDQNTSISLLTNTSTSPVVKSIIIPKVNKVLSIHRQDFNFDGKVDYMIYSLSQAKDKIILTFLDSDLKPLYKDLQNSQWNWALTTFEGLPIDGNSEKFDWLKIQSPIFGSILTPSINRTYNLNELDNSKNILDRVVQAKEHQFYLNPVLSGNSINIDVRAIDSVSYIKSLRQSLKLTDSFQINLVNSIPQGVELASKGIVRMLYLISDNEEVKYYEVQSSGTIYAIKAALPIENAFQYSYLNLKDNSFSKEHLMTSLINRSKASFIDRIDNTIQYSKDLVNTWENPIIGLIGAFIDQDSRSIFVENRYTVSFSDQSGRFKYELPVYRDSSFPGQSFSESLIPVVSNGRAGVFVNSTLIFGERIYSMIGSNEELIRPLKYSVNVPDGCVALSPEKLDGDSSQYVFICTNANKEVSLKFLAIK